MRWLPVKVIQKYGCRSCSDMTMIEKHRYCPYEECPYSKELDEYNGYADFVEQTEERTNGILKELFMIK